MRSRQPCAVAALLALGCAVLVAAPERAAGARMVFVDDDTRPLAVGDVVRAAAPPPANGTLPAGVLRLPADFAATVNGDFELVLVTQPGSASPALSQAPLVLNMDPLSGADVGLSLGAGSSLAALPLRVANGSVLAEHVFEHELLRLNTTVLRSLRVRRLEHGRRFTLLIDGAEVGSVDLPVTGDIYAGQGLLFGQVDGFFFAGTLFHLRVLALSVCDFQPCGENQLCTPTNTTTNSTSTAYRVSSYQCRCADGFDPAFQGSRDCIPVARTCRSCSTLQWKSLSSAAPGKDRVCATSVAASGERPPAMNLTAAQDFCQALGARLCTAGELLTDLAHTPECDSEGERRWSQSPCGNGTFLSLVCSSSPASSPGPVCSTPGANLSVRCCADEHAAGATSAKTCEELQWAPTAAGVAEDVCGESDLRVNRNGASVSPTCFSGTFSEARQICAANGARLCTVQEVQTGEPAGSGCNYDLRVVWTGNDCTSDGSQAWALNGKGLTAPTCLLKNTTLPVRCCADTQPSQERKLSSKTCFELGWDTSRGSSLVCGESFLDCTPFPTFNDSQPYEKAQEYCQSLGARLCTFNELLAGETAGTGCIYDTHRVWSTTSCSCETDAVLTHAGNVEFASSAAVECTPKTDRAFIRCCADVYADCSRAGLYDGNCAAIKRSPCTTERNTCGDCFPGLSGTSGPSNAPDCTDITPPVIRSCPDNISVVLNFANSSGEIVTWPAPDASDSYLLDSVVSSPPSGSFFGLGLSKVQVVARDTASLTDECFFFVDVQYNCSEAGTEDTDCGGLNRQSCAALHTCGRCLPGYAAASQFLGNTPCEPDTDAPRAVCPANMTIELMDGEWQVNVTWVPPPTTDNGVVLVDIFTPASGSTFDLGTTQVMRAVGDEAGNTDRCVFTVTVRCHGDAFQWAGVCRRVQTCQPGFEQLVAPTATSDRVCRPCPAGTFNDAFGSVCKPCTSACPPGSFLAPCLPTQTAQSRDAQCIPCPPATFKAGLTNATQCQPVVQDCGSGQYLVDTGDATRNGSCAPCSVCPAGFHRSGGCDGRLQNTTCAPCLVSSDCRTNEYVAGVCDPASLRGPVCRACDGTCGTCSGPEPTQCTSCMPPSKFLDNQCVSKCSPGQFEATDLEMGGALVCRACDASCGDSCRGPAPTDCLACPAGKFLDSGRCIANCSATGNKFKNNATGNCEPCLVCPSGSYTVEPCSEFQDSICQQWSTCERSEYEVQSGSPTRDRVCKSCTTCPPGTRTAAACKAAADTSCIPCNGISEYQPFAGQTSCFPATVPCGAGSFQQVPVTQTSDRVCSPCEPDEGFYQDNVGQLLCKPLTICAAGEEQVLAPTRFENRICRPCLLGSTFKADAGQNTTCQPTRQCVAGEEVATAASRTSDRVCHPCAPGHFQDEPGGRSCKPCQPGFYQNATEFTQPTASTDRICGGVLYLYFAGSLAETLPSVEARDQFRSALLSELKRLAGSAAPVRIIALFSGSIVARITSPKPAVLNTIYSAASKGQLAVNVPFLAQPLQANVDAPQSSGSSDSDSSSDTMPYIIVAVVAFCAVVAVTFAVVVLRRRKKFMIASANFHYQPKKATSDGHANPAYDATVEDDQLDEDGTITSVSGVAESALTGRQDASKSPLSSTIAPGHLPPAPLECTGLATSITDAPSPVITLRNFLQRIDEDEDDVMDTIDINRRDSTI